MYHIYTYMIDLTEIYIIYTHIQWILLRYISYIHIYNGSYSDIYHIYTYIMALTQLLKKHLPQRGWTRGIMLCEISQTEEDRYSLTCMWN